MSQVKEPRIQVVSITPYRVRLEIVFDHESWGAGKEESHG